ncbi:hypothetical protein [Paludibaculum fermentans]|uniref:Uncharacterized protein n=1 Tax=Paludibaculum fermentans TaxID=1473598 RepID=A0A7S7NXQ0_PALFE|nr:hypothetical protein [Paludibaculum fermentans]QOY91661.1 hypothetical protein IRI77_17465 [Paludibaculum fermentans]
MSPFVITILSSAAFILVLGWIYRRISVSRSGEGVSEQWWQEFSPDRYAPLTRLLAKEDFEFVQTLAGYRPGLEKRLRSRRIAIFSAYLLGMRQDFDRLHSVGQALLISGHHTPGLQDQLFRLRLEFLRSWWMVRAELALYQFGICEVDPAKLVQTFQGAAKLFVPEPMFAPTAA